MWQSHTSNLAPSRFWQRMGVTHIGGSRAQLHRLLGALTPSVVGDAVGSPTGAYCSPDGPKRMEIQGKNTD